jgi:hypothetical protein
VAGRAAWGSRAIMRPRTSGLCHDVRPSPAGVPRSTVPGYDPGTTCSIFQISLRAPAARRPKTT